MQAWQFLIYGALWDRKHSKKKKSVRVIKSQFARQHLQNKQGKTGRGWLENSAERSRLVADLC